MLTLVSVAAIVGVLLASGAVYCLRHSSHYRLKERLSGLGAPGPDATAAYQVRLLLLPGRSADLARRSWPLACSLFLVRVTLR